jgi:hypothetical protein
MASDRVACPRYPSRVPIVPRGLRGHGTLGGVNMASEITTGRDPVEKLAEEFAERYRRGESPSVTEYTTATRNWPTRYSNCSPP